MPCGIPDQAWPGGYGNIDNENGLRYDTSTGKLWAKPDDVHTTYESSGTYTTHGSAVFQYGSYLRVAWSPLFNLTGGAGQVREIAKSGIITVTNSSATSQSIRVIAGVPANEWMLGWSMVRPRLQLQLFVDDGGGLTPRWGDEWTLHPFSFTQYNYVGGDINARIQTEPLFQDNLPYDTSGQPHIFDAASSGNKYHMRFPARSVDFMSIAPGSTTATLPKGATWRYQVKLNAVTPDTSIFNVGPLPAIHYLWGATQIMRPVDLLVTQDSRT